MRAEFNVTFDYISDQPIRMLVDSMQRTPNLSIHLECCLAITKILPSMAIATQQNTSYMVFGPTRIKSPNSTSICFCTHRPCCTCFDICISKLHLFTQCMCGWATYVMRPYNNHSSDDNIYGAVIVASRHCESLPSSYGECRLSAIWPPPPKRTQTMWVHWQAATIHITIAIYYNYSAHELSHGQQQMHTNCA